MSLTNTGEDSLLNLFKGSGPHYLALFTVTPSEAGGGTEVSGGAYARQAVTFGSPSGGTMKNSAEIVFPTATASWGTVKAWAIFDAASSGSMLWYGDIAVPKELLAADVYLIEAGGLTLTMD